MKCKHEMYDNLNHLTATEALSEMKKSNVVWMGMVIKRCEACGSDISSKRIVKVIYVNDYIKQLGG